LLYVSKLELRVDVVFLAPHAATAARRQRQTDRQTDRQIDKTGRHSSQSEN